MSKLDYLNPYHWVMKVRNELYDRGVIGSQEHSAPVISIGNINMGGSGKTPFIQFLVGAIKHNQANKNILVISKSYKATLKEPREVTLNDVSQTHVFGDEPCLLKSLIDADVWSGPVKYKTLSAALKSKKYDLVIVDDGFSHLKIKRDLDIVLFDVSRDLSHYNVVPFGFMREAWSSLSRADVVILTKTENQPQEKIDFYKNKISEYQNNILISHFEIKLKTDVKDLFLFTGLGNPKALSQNLKTLGFNIVSENLYPDHFNFTEDVQKTILKKYQNLKLTSDVALVTTAKDFIKIDWPELKKHVKVIELKVSMEPSDFKKINEMLNEKIR